MRRDQLEHAIRAVCQIIQQPEVIVVGTQAILGTYDESQLPAAATVSIEVDLETLSCQTAGASALLARGPVNPWQTPSLRSWSHRACATAFGGRTADRRHRWKLANTPGCNGFSWAVARNSTPTPASRGRVVSKRTALGRKHRRAPTQRFRWIRALSERGTPDRIRTGATALRGRRARPLHNGGNAANSVRTTRRNSSHLPLFTPNRGH